MSELGREEEWLLIDSRPSNSNHLLFWRKNGAGYTTDIKEAHVFTREEAYRQHRSRDTDIPVQKALMVDMSQQAVLWDKYFIWRSENVNNS